MSTACRGAARDNVAISPVFLVFTTDVKKEHNRLTLKLISGRLSRNALSDVELKTFYYQLLSFV